MSSRIKGIIDAVSDLAMDYSSRMARAQEQDFDWADSSSRDGIDYASKAMRDGDPQAQAFSQYLADNNIPYKPHVARTGSTYIDVLGDPYKLRDGGYSQKALQYRFADHSKGKFGQDSFLGAKHIDSSMEADVFPGGNTLEQAIVKLEDTPGVRSSDAAFDPAQRFDKNYLAEVTGAGLLGGSMFASEDADAGILSRIARAQDQGFDMSPESRLYHASKQDIQEMKAGYDDGLVFTTPDPDFANQWLGKGKFQERQTGGSIEGIKKEKEQWNLEADKKLKSLPESERQQYFENVLLPQRQKLLIDERHADSAIYPLVSRTKKPYRPDQDFKVLEEFYGKEYLDAPFGSGFDTFRDAMKDGNYLLYENKEVVEFLKSKGYDSMFLKETAGKDAPFSTMAIFDGGDLRSPNAQFNDPSSRNLLAGSATTAVGSSALFSPDDAQASNQPASKGLMESFGDTALETMSGVNRAAADGVNFLTSDQINAILNLSGSDKRIPDLYDIPGVESGTKGNYMEPGLLRQIVRQGSEFLSPI